MQRRIADRLQELGLVLPAPMVVPQDLALPFSWVKVLGRRVVLSGHLPLAADGTLWASRGKLGTELGIGGGYIAARQATLAMLGSLERELGTLDRISNWVRILGMVNTGPGFTQTAPVINGCSDLLIAVFGRDAGSHVRSAVGFAEIPFGCPVEIEGEVEIDS